MAVHASQIVYRDTTLEHAATLATTILVATLLSTDDDHGTVYRFRAERVLVGSGAAAGAEIRVRRAHYTEWTTAMRVAESTGVSRSPLIYRLPSPPSVELAPAGRFCLLLDDHSVDPGALELAVEGGHLPEAACAQVAGLHGAP
jgi:hypothetical protein